MTTYTLTAALVLAILIAGWLWLDLRTAYLLLDEQRRQRLQLERYIADQTARIDALVAEVNEVNQHNAALLQFTRREAYLYVTYTQPMLDGPQTVWGNKALSAN